MDGNEHLLQCLIERVSAAIQHSLGAVQRGLDNVTPRTGASKREELLAELNAIHGVVELIESTGMFPYDVLSAERLAARAKSFSGIRVERYLLTTLSKRFAEVVECLSKAVRFGPSESSPGVRLTNAQQVQNRLFEAFVVVHLLTEIGSLPEDYLSREKVLLSQAKIQSWRSAAGFISA